MDNSPWFDHAEHVRPAPHPPRRHRRQRHRPTSSTSAATARGSASTAPATPGARRATLPFPVATGNVGQIQVADLLGNGTACLVWSSALPGDARRPMRYLDLMGGKKPHLLIEMRNNLAPRRRCEYAPSTKFYLQDKAAGTPWVTRLPFPVHCVETVTVDRSRRRKTDVLNDLQLSPRLLRRRRARVPRLRPRRAGRRAALRRLLRPPTRDSPYVTARPDAVPAAGQDDHLVSHRHRRSTARASSRSFEHEYFPARFAEAGSRPPRSPSANCRSPRSKPQDPGTRRRRVARGHARLQGHDAAPGGLRTRRRRAAGSRRARTGTSCSPPPSTTATSAACSRAGPTARRLSRHRERGDHLPLRAGRSTATDDAGARSAGRAHAQSALRRRTAAPCSRWPPSTRATAHTTNTPRRARAADAPSSLTLIRGRPDASSTSPTPRLDSPTSICRRRSIPIACPRRARCAPTSSPGSCRAGRHSGTSLARRAARLPARTPYSTPRPPRRSARSAITSSHRTDSPHERLVEHVATLYFKDDLSGPLAIGQPSRLGLDLRDLQAGADRPRW